MRRSSPESLAGNRSVHTNCPLLEKTRYVIQEIDGESIMSGRQLLPYLIELFGKEMAISPADDARRLRVYPANVVHIRQSRPDSGLGFQVKVLTTS